jgi:hypothetical protein
MNRATQEPSAELRVTHVVRGEVVNVSSAAVTGPGFRAPALDLDSLVWTRADGLPAEQLKIDEVFDFLEATGDVIRAGTSPYLQQANENLSALSGKSIKAIATDVQNMSTMFRRELFSLEYERNIGHPRSGYQDGEWRRHVGYQGEEFDVRAVPTRTLHIMAGNGYPYCARPWDGPPEAPIE